MTGEPNELGVTLLQCISQKPTELLEQCYSTFQVFDKHRDNIGS